MLLWLHLSNANILYITLETCLQNKYHFCSVRHHRGFESKQSSVDCKPLFKLLDDRRSFQRHNE